MNEQSTSRGQLLIVDDEEELLSLLEETLANPNIEIHTALNGKEGLEVLSTQNIDCVISDISMPIMDGVEFIKKARAENHEMPFIFFTGHGNESILDEVSRYGAFDFLNKPGLEDLEASVERAIKAVKQDGFQVSKHEGLNEEERREYINILEKNKKD